MVLKLCVRCNGECRVVNSNHNLGGWMFLQNNPEPEDPAGHYLVAPASLRMTETPVDVRRVGWEPSI